MELQRAMSLKDAYTYGIECGLENEVGDIRNMIIEWDSNYTSSLRRGYLIDLFEARGLFEVFMNRYWQFGKTASGESYRRRMLRIRADYEDFLAGRAPEPEAVGNNETIEDSLSNVEFALEAHLRDFLVKNLDHIEKGLTVFNSEGRFGVEYSIDGGRIDILAVDQSGKYVVIELKLSQGRNKTLGQILYYMGWIDKHLGNGPCRGFIVANEISEELQTAVSRVSGVNLAKYRMSFTIERVN